MSHDDVKSCLMLLENWVMAEDGKAVSRKFVFNNFHETMAFINAMAWISHTQDHHPDFSAGYKHCQVSYTSHAIAGLSRNDFICAAKLNKLFK